MFKILAFVAVWKRPEITERCFKGIKDLGLPIFAVVSEDWAEDLCKKYGADYVRTPNTPLGKKFNTGLEGALKKDFDYLMTFNSDTLINPELLQVYKYHMEQNTGLIGVDKVYFVQDGKAKHVDYQLQIIGAGRMFSRDALETAKQVKVRFNKSVGGVINGFPTEEKYIPVHRAVSAHRSGIVEILGEEKIRLWDDEKERGLDGNSNMKLIHDQVSNKCIDIGKNPYIIDLKGDENIWKYEDIQGEVADYNFVMRCFQEN